MDTIEINRLLTKEKEYVGTFALDKLPWKKVKVPASFIINNDVSSKEGDHWVALVITKNEAFYLIYLFLFETSGSEHLKMRKKT